MGSVANPPHFGDYSVPNGDIGGGGRVAGSVENQTRPDHKIWHRHAVSVPPAMPVALALGHRRAGLRSRGLVGGK